MPRHRIKNQYFTFRPRIYLSEKYQDLVKFLTSYYQGRNVVSVLLEKFLNTVLLHVEKNDWETKIFEILQNETREVDGKLAIKTEKTDSLLDRPPEKTSEENLENNFLSVDLSEVIEKF